MTIIKLGGSFLDSGVSIERFIRCLDTFDDSVVLVHGGGGSIDTLANSLGVAHSKIDGIRSTSKELMDVVDMVLTGKVNTWLVRKLCRYGYPAVGISLSSLHMALTQLKSSATDEYTGTIYQIDTHLITCLLTNDMLPVISPSAMNTNGEGVNVNADDAAASLAVALQADHLLFISDVPGVLNNKSVMTRLTLAECRKLIGNNVITTGMTAKIMAANRALRKGVFHVAISTIEQTDDLNNIIQDKKGTSIYVA